MLLKGGGCNPLNPSPGSASEDANTITTGWYPYLPRDLYFETKLLSYVFRKHFPVSSFAKSSSEKITASSKGRVGINSLNFASRFQLRHNLSIEFSIYTCLSLPVLPKFLNDSLNSTRTCDSSNIQRSLLSVRRNQRLVSRFYSAFSLYGCEFILSSQLITPKLSCYTPTPKQHRSFFKNTPPYSFVF